MWFTLLTMAVAVSLEPFRIGMTILMLNRPRPLLQLLAFLAGLAAIFFEIPALSLTVSATFVLLMSGLILYETSNIIHGGETNYISATLAVYLDIYNVFVSLLQLIMAFTGERD